MVTSTPLSDPNFDPPSTVLRTSYSVTQILILFRLRPMTEFRIPLPYSLIGLKNSYLNNHVSFFSSTIHIGMCRHHFRKRKTSVDIGF